MSVPLQSGCVLWTWRRLMKLFPKESFGKCFKCKGFLFFPPSFQTEVTVHESHKKKLPRYFESKPMID